MLASIVMAALATVALPEPIREGHSLERALAERRTVREFAAVESRTTGKYGGRATRYVHIEVGHAAQNVLLQATASGLAAAPVGAFDDRGVKVLLALPREADPLYLLPVGRPR